MTNRSAVPQRLAAKERAELEYWIGLSRQLTNDCATPAQCRRALLDVCQEKTFPRYLDSLDLHADSLAGLRVLDLGCGPHGGLIGFRGCERWGADHLIAEYRAIGYPLAAHGIRYVQCKSEALPFPEGSFDAVLCVNALDHVDDVDLTFREIGRVLAPGGHLLAQINFHPTATPTEPHCFRHGDLLETARRHHLGPRRIEYQTWVPGAGEHRYLYHLEHDFPRP